VVPRGVVHACILSKSGGKWRGGASRTDTKKNGGGEAHFENFPTAGDRKKIFLLLKPTDLIEASKVCLP
jgi:hypothetical protein